VTAYRAIDIHHHYAPAGYRAVATRHARSDPTFAKLNHRVCPGDDADPLVRLDLRLAEMAAAGLDAVVLSLNPPSAAPDDAGLATELFAAANDGLLEACAAHPDRFTMMAALPLPHAGAALRELDRLAGRPAVRAVCIGGSAFAYRPDDPAWTDVLERIQELGLPLALHPSLQAPAGSDDPMLSAFGDFRLMPGVLSMVGTTVVALRFALSGLLDRLPRLEVIVPHLGGVVPYLAQRLEDQTRGTNVAELSFYLRERFWYDNCSFHPPALACAIDTVGAERIMLGSDYPFRGDLGRCVASARGAAVSDGQRARILGATAAGRFAPH
jgi:aminocarboxymuconate-semialdehyde decarboxylase